MFPRQLGYEISRGRHEVNSYYLWYVVGKLMTVNSYIITVWLNLTIIENNIGTYSDKIKKKLINLLKCPHII